MWGYGLDRAGSGKGEVLGCCECGNEFSGFVKCGALVEVLMASQEGSCSMKLVRYFVSPA